jgi:hypothetical protein
MNFRAQIRKNQSKSEKSNSTIPIRSEFITHSDRIRGKNLEEFNTYSARMQSSFGPNRRKPENTQYLSKFKQFLLTYSDRMDPLIGPNRSNCEQCTFLLFLGGFFNFLVFIFGFIYIRGLKKLPGRILDIIE